MSMAFSISNALKNPANVAILRKHGVIYVDRGLIALNKMPGLVTQGTTNVHKKEGTIQVAIDDIKDALGLKGGPFTVHRLDKSTTGLFVLAPTTTQAKILSKAYTRGPNSNDVIVPAVKRYLALVHTKSTQAQRLLRGEMSNVVQVGVKRSVNIGLYINEDGFVSIWDEGVKGLSNSDVQQKMKRRKAALTDLEVLGVSPHYPIALVWLRLHTGIKHQLRVTLGSFCRAPILGDHRYGNETDKTIIPIDVVPPDTLMLHSSSLELQRYQHKYGFSPFTILAPVPVAISQACEGAGIPLAAELKKGGVWRGDQEKLRVQDGTRFSPISEGELNGSGPLYNSEPKEAGFWLLD